jgi:hypothetical protein
VLELKADAYLALDAGYKVLVTTRGMAELLPELEAAPRESDLLLSLMNPENKSRWCEILDIVWAGKPISLNTKTLEQEEVKLSLQPVYNQQEEVIALLIAAKKS